MDPWGLEGSGARLPEMGCKMGHSWGLNPIAPMESKRKLDRVPPPPPPPEPKNRKEQKVNNTSFWKRTQKICAQCLILTGCVESLTQGVVVLEPRVHFQFGQRQVALRAMGWHIEGRQLEGPTATWATRGMQKFRHVKLARQAMAFWQSYDAFARTRTRDSGLGTRSAPTGRLA